MLPSAQAGWTCLQVLDLAPASCRGVERSIPIMTTDDGVGSRTIIAETTSPLSGLIQVCQAMMRKAFLSPPHLSAGIGVTCRWPTCVTDSSPKPYLNHQSACSGNIQGDNRLRYVIVMHRLQDALPILMSSFLRSALRRSCLWQGLQYIQSIVCWTCSSSCIITGKRNVKARLRI